MIHHHEKESAEKISKAEQWKMLDSSADNGRRTRMRLNGGCGDGRKKRRAAADFHVILNGRAESGKYAARADGSICQSGHVPRRPLRSWLLIMAIGYVMLLVHVQPPSTSISHIHKH